MGVGGHGKLVSLTALIEWSILAPLIFFTSPLSSWGCFPCATAFKNSCSPAPLLTSAGSPVLRFRSGNRGDEPGPVHGELFSDGPVSEHRRSIFREPNAEMGVSSCPRRTFWLTLKPVRTKAESGKSCAGA